MSELIEQTYEDYIIELKKEIKAIGLYEAVKKRCAKLINRDGTPSIELIEDILSLIETSEQANKVICSDSEEENKREEKKMENSNQYIVIVFRNGDMCHYKPEDYTDYKYDGKYFIVIRERQWIGFYNLDCVEYIEVTAEVDNA